MGTSRKTGLICMLLLVFCALLAGCAKENSDARSAERLYKQGKYSEAEPFFNQALADSPGDKNLHLAHAYNLIALGERSGALDELVGVQDSFTEEKIKLAIREAMLDIHMADGNYVGAARICSELSDMVKDRAKADEYNLKAAIIRADIYREQDSRDKLKDELRNIIALENYAGDAYYELYAMSIEEDEREERLKLADEIAGYMTGHNTYITDYCPIVSVMFDAAKVAGFTEWSRTPDDYFNLAEEFISRAEDAGLSADELLKYKIIIAERQGRMESAYRLLGVYLNHCPSDREAVKEHDYLEARLGLTEP